MELDHVGRLEVQQVAVVLHLARQGKASYLTLKTSSRGGRCKLDPAWPGPRPLLSVVTLPSIACYSQCGVWCTLSKCLASLCSLEVVTGAQYDVYSHGMLIPSSFRNDCAPSKHLGPAGWGASRTRSQPQLARWLAQAATRGRARAGRRLPSIYANGHGVRPTMQSNAIRSAPTPCRVASCRVAEGPGRVLGRELVIAEGAEQLAHQHVCLAWRLPHLGTATGGAVLVTARPPSRPPSHIS